MGRTKRPPMDERDMLDLAKALLMRKGWSSNNKVEWYILVFRG